MATRSDGRTYTWDYDNRLTAVTGGSSFTYNFSGQRVQKTEGGVTTYYFFGNYEEEYQSGALTLNISLPGRKKIAVVCIITGQDIMIPNWGGLSVRI